MSQMVPSDNDALLVFGNIHAPVFAASAASIGLTPQQATQFAAANTAMQAAWTELGKAVAAMRQASADWQGTRNAFRTLAVADCQLIKNFAQRQADPAAVYALAQLPAPSPRSPSIPPSTATDLRATLDTQTGELTVRWKATQPKSVTGVVYSVQRVLGTGTGFATVGLTGGKSFVDPNIPAGTTRIQYRVVAQRGGLVSPASAVLDVRLATDASGAVSIVGLRTAA